MTCLQLTLGIVAVALLLTTLQERSIPDRDRGLERKRRNDERPEREPVAIDPAGPAALRTPGWRERAVRPASATPPDNRRS